MLNESNLHVCTAIRIHLSKKENLELRNLNFESV